MSLDQALIGALVILVLTLLIPFAYIYAWPRGVTRRALFLVVTLTLALIVAAALVFWFLDAVVGVGIAGQSGGLAGDIAVIKARIRTRFVTASFVGVLVEYLICHATQHSLKR